MTTFTRLTQPLPDHWDTQPGQPYLAYSLARNAEARATTFLVQSPSNPDFTALLVAARVLGNLVIEAPTNLDRVSRILECTSDAALIELSRLYVDDPTTSPEVCTTDFHRVLWLITKSFVLFSQTPIRTEEVPRPGGPDAATPVIPLRDTPFDPTSTDGNRAATLPNVRHRASHRAQLPTRIFLLDKCSGGRH